MSLKVKNNSELVQDCEQARLQVKGVLAQLPSVDQTTLSHREDYRALVLPLPQLLEYINAQLSAVLPAVSSLSKRCEVINHEISTLPYYQNLLRQLDSIAVAPVYFSHLATSIFQVETNAEIYFRKLIEQLEIDLDRQFYIAAQGNVKTSESRINTVFVALYPHCYTETVHSLAALYGINEVYLPEYLAGRNFSEALAVIERRQSELLAERSEVVAELEGLAARWRPRLITWRKALSNNAVNKLETRSNTSEEQKGRGLFSLFIHLGKIIVSSRDSELTMKSYVRIALPLVLGFAIGNATYGSLSLALVVYFGIIQEQEYRNFLWQVTVLVSLWSLFFGVTLGNYSPANLAGWQQYDTLKLLVGFVGVIGGGYVLLAEISRRVQALVRRRFQQRLSFIVDIIFVAGLFGVAGSVARYFTTYNLSLNTALLVVITVILLYITESVHELGARKNIGKIVFYGHAVLFGLSVLCIVEWATNITTSILLGCAVVVLNRALKNIANLPSFAANDAVVNRDEEELLEEPVNLCYSR